MKILIAVFSCHKYVYSDGLIQDWFAPLRKNHDRVKALRETWLQDAKSFGLDYKIFKGRAPKGVTPNSVIPDDEVWLNCADEYFKASEKIRAIAQWVEQNGDYDFVLKVDDDSFVYLDRLLDSGFEKHDYSGRAGQTVEYVPGGPCYWLSRQCVKIIARGGYPSVWQEDVYVGKLLGANGIKQHRDLRYVFGDKKIYITPDELPPNHDYIALTACAPETMKTLYDEWKQSL